jgi:hypothetical protein
MRNRTPNKVLFASSRIMLILSITLFVLTAGMFAWFGFIPTEYDPSTGETTYRVIGSSFTLDGRIAETFGVSMLSARFLSHAYIVASCLLAAGFFWQAFRIVASAQAGNSFSSANAVRLSRMGWMAIVPLAVAIGFCVLRLEWPTSDQFISLILMATLSLVLNVLALVFRHGAALRDDLEGTV